LDESPKIVEIYPCQRYEAVANPICKSACTLNKLQETNSRKCTYHFSHMRALARVNRESRKALERLATMQLKERQPGSEDNVQVPVETVYFNFDIDTLAIGSDDLEKLYPIYSLTKPNSVTGFNKVTKLLISIPNDQYKSWLSPTSEKIGGFVASFMSLKELYIEVRNVPQGKAPGFIKRLARPKETRLTPGGPLSRSLSYDVYLCRVQIARERRDTRKSPLNALELVTCERMMPQGDIRRSCE